MSTNEAAFEMWRQVREEEEEFMRSVVVPKKK